VPALDAALLSVLTGSGVAGVFCALFVFGRIFPASVLTDLRAENTELKAALKAERDRADAAVAAAQGTRDILAALQAGARLGITAAERPGTGGGSA